MLKRVVDRFGWETLCKTDNPEADRAHFLRLYQAELTRQRDERHAAEGLLPPSDQTRRDAIAGSPEAQHADGREPVALPAPTDTSGAPDSVQSIKAMNDRATIAGT